MNSVLAVTGHRPDRLFVGANRTRGQRRDYSNSLARVKLLKLAEAEIAAIAPFRVLTGMALGWDTVVAEACLNLGIPFVACIPCDDQDVIWMQADKIRYRHLLKLAAGVVNVSPGPYETWKMFTRNEYLVDHCDVLLTLWDGNYTGGTGRCVQYAERRKLRDQKPKIVHCWDSWLKIYESLSHLTT